MTPQKKGGDGGMIVFDIGCSKGHRFEAWFKDSATYDRQAAAGEVVCPMCGDRHVAKAPMAPRLTRALSRGGEEAGDTTQAIRNTLNALRQAVEANFDYVGDRFADEARRIHYGDTRKRGIYGETTADEARDLHEEGVEFTAVPWGRRDS